jgi:methionyl-tRNA formyltransferase
MSKTIVFFGNERLATGVTTTCPTIRALIANGYNIATIISHSTISNPSRSFRKLEIESIAKEYNIPILFPPKLDEVKDYLKSLSASAGVLVAYGKIVPQSIIDIFPFGIINIHPSDLPLHRGPTPLESIILDGSSQTAVSIMQLSKGMDEGAVFAKQYIQLDGNESKQELANQVAEVGKNLVIDNLPGILSSRIKPIPQDSSLATYDRLISKDDGNIDISKTANQIEREIRAYTTWPKSRLSIADQNIIVTKAHVTNSINSQLDVKCGNSTILSIDELIAPSGRTMSAKSFINGYLNT